MQATQTRRLPRPKNQMAHLLFEMIKGRMISERQFSYNRFRGSLADLRNDHNVPVFHHDETFVNSFGRSSYYRSHFIRKDDREFCISVYLKINL